MFLDPTILSSGAIGDEEGVDIVADSGIEDVAVFKDDPDDDNDADDDKDDEKDNDDDCEGDGTVASDVVMVIIDKDGDVDDNSGVDCCGGDSVQFR